MSPTPSTFDASCTATPLLRASSASTSSHRQIVLQRPIPRPSLKASKRYEARTWTDADDTALSEHFNSRGFNRVGRNLVRDIIELEARSRRFIRCATILTALKWDGAPRLSRFLIEFCGAAREATPWGADRRRDLHTGVTRCLLHLGGGAHLQAGLQGRLHAYPGGPQGATKSRLLRKLAMRDEWFSDSLPHDLTSKDARQHLAGQWLVEMGEIAQFRRSEIETVKSYLSCQFDKYRPPYGRSDITVPRQCVFVGTTNANAYLHDPTGNRRFWPVKVGTIRLAKVGTTRQPALGRGGRRLSQGRAVVAVVKARASCRPRAAGPA